MPAYEHTQIGYVTGGALLAGAVITYLSSRNAEGKWGWWGPGLALGLTAGAVLFSSLTVQVTEEELRFYFGPGFWDQRISLDDIQEVEVVHNPLYYGWGIRYTAPGWLYNVSGRQAVELDVHGKAPIRIGTDEPDSLKRALEQARQGG